MVPTDRGLIPGGPDEATEAESLRRLGEEYARYRQVAPPSHWRDWKEAIDALLALGDSRALPVIIDSFPDLVAASPALTSTIHGALRRVERSAQANRARLILGGSTAPVMNRLFAPASSLEALSGLKLDLQPLDFRKAAQLWGIDDPELAFRVYAVVGGTPAYRHDYVGGDVPVDRNDFDAWVCRTVLNPRMPLFREARHLVDEETGHQSPGACHSVGHEAEVVVRKRDGHKTGALLSVGIARWHTGMDIHHLQRLHDVLDTLATQEEDVSRVRPALYSASGFSPELHAAEARDEVMLIDLERLYRGA
ncbi:MULTISPECIES: hypothetical protein [unclassified Streptomyces]|uniref:AAA family ATPase n=1 Tax=unclassified Streptomyces TaxID=2593676 RepID=UPI00331712AC